MNLTLKRFEESLSLRSRAGRLGHQKLEDAIVARGYRTEFFMATCGSLSLQAQGSERPGLVLFRRSLAGCFRAG
jgi:hypothetical protein